MVNVKGTFYGTTFGTGPQGSGTVYSVTPRGVEKIIMNFGCPPSGCGGTVWPVNPEAPVIAVGGMLYGTTISGEGAPTYGTVFQVAP